MFYGIKIQGTAISLMTFKSQLAVVENTFTEITEDKYNELVTECTNDPFGTYVDGKWKKEHPGDKAIREQEKITRKAEKMLEMELAADNEFIARYNRLKTEGLII